MKAVKIILVVVFTAALIQGAKLGYSYFLPQVIPLCHGYRPGIYDLIGIVMIILFIFLFIRTGKRKRRSKGRNPYSQRNRQYRASSPRYNSR